MARGFKRRGFDAIVAVSNSVAVRNGIADLESVTVVPNFIPDELRPRELLPRPKWLPQGPFILYVGDVSRDKGVNCLLAAYEQIVGPKPALVLLGRMVDAEYSRTDGVVYAGARSHADVECAYGHALLAVAPSLWPDPCPTVVLEAMAFGVPIVASRTGGISDMIVDGHSGALVPPSDVNALCRAIEEVIASSQVRQRYAKNSLIRVQEFRVSSVARRIEAIYEAISSGANPEGK
jgi:glycosyltransferase involved in cell wall biosynthesis